MSDRIAEIKKRLSAATPGPWYSSLVNGESVNGAHIQSDKYLIARISREADKPIGQKANDIELIANAPSDIQYLLQAVEILWGALEFYGAHPAPMGLMKRTKELFEYDDNSRPVSYGKRAREAMKRVEELG